jgi:hypothetical protein
MTDLRVGNGNVSSQLAYNCISGSSCGVGGFVSDPRSVNNGSSLEKADKNQENIENQGPPIFRRLVLAILLNLGGYGVAVWGIEHFNDNRRLLRASFIVGGWLLLSSGFLLMFVTDFPSTWGWPL